MSETTPPLDALADSLLEGLAAQLPAEGFRLDSIEVRVGAALDVDPAALQAALEARLPGVMVSMVSVEAVLKCLDCGAEYPADEHPCPACGSGNAALVAGDELEISRARGTRLS